MSRPLIVFKLRFCCTTGWGAISNFITKFSEKIPMESLDVEIASSIVLEEKKLDDNFSLIKQIDDNWAKFKRIRKPENIYETGSKYEFAFFISIEFNQLFDVVDLQNLYLIRDAHRQDRIIALISGEQSEYHKTSHFFALLTENKEDIYNDIFFKARGIKHLQTAGIGVLSKFLPLVPVDASEDLRMRQRVREFVTVEYVKELLAGMETGDSVPRIIEGACRNLSRYHKYLNNCDIEKCAAFLSDLSVLSFLLFCFSLGGKKRPFFDFFEFSENLQRVTLWSNGCVQLLENIVFHSINKKGAFSFRILDGKAAYIKEKYSLTDAHEKWIEMMIVDYAGCSRTLNIAEKFLDNLNDSDIKNAFADLKPKHFFSGDENEKISQAWKRYYSDKKNVVNHYGLKIFQKVVRDSNGHFIAQSFSTHRPQEDELYYDADGTVLNIPKICMPGTSYSILFPIVQENDKRKFADYGIEDFEDKIDSQDILFDYIRSEKKIPIIRKIVSSQEKMELINQIAHSLLDVKVENKDKQSDVKEERFIITVDAAGFRGDTAEIIYKAVILALSQFGCKCHIVMYECQREFVQIFLDAAYLGWINLRGELNYKDDGQIVLYTADYYEEIIIMPGNWQDTLQINRFNNFSRETRWSDYFEKWESGIGEGSSAKILKRYPFDILAGENLGNTVFEKYAQTVIKRNIQGQELGCKIENVHMRLGSTIHVDHFYEAEILFGNSLFVERFALLMIKRMLEPLEESFAPLKANDKVTLYGYANYSEQTVFCTMQFLRQVLPGIDVDYAILERESEDRGLAHVDRIRYSTDLGLEGTDAEARKKHFQFRKIICIIPIASTLKTNEKMINLFLEQNGNGCKPSFWRNFELILVGSSGENKYWEKDEKRIIGKEGMKILPIPEFFVEVTLDYMEPLECTMCFPENVIDELPLIEVNAASTIPNQAFGLCSEECEPCKITKKELRREENKQEVLKDILIYRHLERNENHFLWYFQTERLIVKYPEKIRDWLKEIKEKIEVKKNDYVILFCPAHFSNAGFIEYVNSYVFGSAAMIIRDDVDKEYRGNFRTKFSNLRNFIEKLARHASKSGYERIIRLFYVDDSIITGRTFHRSRSLAQSIIKDYYPMDDRQRYAVFEGIFVLIDRNSRSSRWQYTGINEEDRLYAFRTVHISSIRNHGDACVYCNLAREAGTLKKSSVTKDMENYWRLEEEKFSVVPLSKYLKNQGKNKGLEKGEEEKKKKERAFRRLVCTNNAMVFLDEKYHGNCKEKVLKQMLMLILTGSYMHKGEEAEYFLSYCKVLSRPFRVFDKSVREAVFDFLLLTSFCFLSEKSYQEIIASSEKKPYLKEQEIKENFFKIEVFVKTFFITQRQRQDLLKVLLKQLTEMKSNFIMRESIMNYILDYASGSDTKDGEGLIRYYKYLIKKLTGVSSDTSKSLWLDQMLRAEWPVNTKEIRQDIYLENVWIYQDAFQKLNERIKMEPSKWENLLESLNKDTFKKMLNKFWGEEIEEYLKPYQFKDFLSVLKQYKMCDESDKLNNDGIIFVASNLLLYRVITLYFKSGLRQTNVMDKGNLTKVDYIATCMKYIMGANEVVIIMEFDAEYDLWENDIVNRFNALLPENMMGERITWEQKKECIILGSSEEKKGRWTFREKDVTAKIYELQRKDGWKEKGYAYDAVEGFFLWELGHDTGYPVYIFATWEDSDQKSISEIERLNRIRSVMQHYWLLNNLTFNKSNEVFFYEIAQQRKKNAIQSRQKAHTHTKSDIKLQQYDHMLRSRKYKKYYQSDLLMLLADLNVSEHYRNSLTAGYYLKGDSLHLNGSSINISPFSKQKQFYVISSEAELTTELIISDNILFAGDIFFKEDDRVVAFDNTNGERDSYLLIYSLMINAVANNRGKVDNGCVTVYLSKTSDGKLRIANEIGENPGDKTPQQIMEELCYPPEEEHQGISLWSVSRYIKGIIASILDANLKELEQSESPVCERMLTRTKQRILQLLGDEFRILVETKKVDEKFYFSVSVPILSEKYEEQKEASIK